MGGVGLERLERHQRWIPAHDGITTTHDRGTRSPNAFFNRGHTFVDPSEGRVTADSEIRSMMKAVSSSVLGNVTLDLKALTTTETYECSDPDPKYCPFGPEVEYLIKTVYDADTKIPVAVRVYEGGLIAADMTVTELRTIPVAEAAMAVSAISD